jgi:prevent-host-death family protein
MKTVGSYEAKTHLPSLLQRVAGGEEITITIHGVPVARLVPVDSIPEAGRLAVIDDIRRFRKGKRRGRRSLKAMIAEGRRQ